jgi:hypothetical protein
MTSLHERLCTWVQVHHLYQPTRNGLLDAYLKHHVAHCLHCQQEIDSIETLGVSVGALDFDVASNPNDASWARLSAALPPRETDTSVSDNGIASKRRPLALRNVAYAAMAVAGVAFAAVYLRTSDTNTPVVTPQAIVSTSPKEDSQVPAATQETALALTREQAKQVAIIETTPSDPFTKAIKPDVKEVEPPPVSLRQPATNRPSAGKKPLIVASSVSAEPVVMTPDVIVTDVPPVESQPRFQAAPVMAMRASAAAVQSDQQVGTANTSHGGGFGTTPASYMPSAAMELTESQNRLRSLLQ